MSVGPNVPLAELCLQVLSDPQACARAPPREVLLARFPFSAVRSLARSETTG